MFRSSLLALVAAAATASAADLKTTLNQRSDMAYFVKYAKAAGLWNNLESMSSVTIFAPVDSAFKTAIAEYPSLVGGNNILSGNNPSQMSTEFVDIMKYHVVPDQTVDPSMISNSTGIFLQTSYDSTMVNPYQDPSGNSMSVYSAEKRISNVMTTIQFDSGYLYLLDSILLPPSGAADTALSMGETYFYGALQKADLVSVFNTTDPITVFIPRNQAWEDVGNRIAELNATELMSTMRYHAVAGQALYLTDLMAMKDQHLKTMADQPWITNQKYDTEGPQWSAGPLVKYDSGHIGNGALYIANARVITPNIMLNNGVAYLIDEVLNYRIGDPEYRFNYHLRGGYPQTGVYGYPWVTSMPIPALTSGVTATSSFTPTSTYATATYPAEYQALTASVSAGAVPVMNVPGGLTVMGMIAALVGMA